MTNTDKYIMHLVIAIEILTHECQRTPYIRAFQQKFRQHGMGTPRPGRRPTQHATNPPSQIISKPSFIVGRAYTQITSEWLFSGENIALTLGQSVEGELTCHSDQLNIYTSASSASLHTCHPQAGLEHRPRLCGPWCSLLQARVNNWSDQLCTTVMA